MFNISKVDNCGAGSALLVNNNPVLTFRKLHLVRSNSTRTQDLRNIHCLVFRLSNVGYKSCFAVRVVAAG